MSKAGFDSGLPSSKPEVTIAIYAVPYKHVILDRTWKRLLHIVCKATKHKQWCFAAQCIYILYPNSIFYTYHFLLYHMHAHMQQLQYNNQVHGIYLNLLSETTEKINDWNETVNFHTRPPLCKSTNCREKIYIYWYQLIHLKQKSSAKSSTNTDHRGQIAWQLLAAMDTWK